MTKTVELHAAFCWTCDDCGRDCYARAVSVSAQSINPDLWPEDFTPMDIAEIEGGEYFRAPTAVTCQHCGAKFAAEHP